MGAGQLHAAFGVAELRDVISHLARHEAEPCCPDPASDRERIELIAVLEGLKSAAAAAQARIMVAFDASQRQQQLAAGVPPERVGGGIGAQVALARRESPHRGNRLLGLAHALVEEMPNTLRALETGLTSEWRATLAARETAVLTHEDRRQVDAELAGRLPTLGDRAVADAAREIGMRLDPGAALRRWQRAIRGRRVTLRPAPGAADCMATLTALLPVVEGVAAYSALTRAADAATATGDDRGRGQVMADTLVRSILGRATGSSGTGGGCAGTKVEIQLVVPAETLFAPGTSDHPADDHPADDHPATDHPADDRPADDRRARSDEAGTDQESANRPGRLIGYGPVPASLARAVARDPDAEVWVRRVFAHPREGTLVATDSRSRFFPPGLRRLLIARDQTCRTAWCDAPIRHLDHVRPARAGGETSAGNGEGLCETCNHSKENPGWSVQAGSQTANPTAPTLAITTPTGNRYPTGAPPLPGTAAA